jgi:hypothetical protein
LWTREKLEYLSVAFSTSKEIIKNILHERITIVVNEEVNETQLVPASSSDE